jgi:hypothetical protein
MRLLPGLGALPGDVGTMKQLTQPFWTDLGETPFLNQVVKQFGHRPIRERQPHIGGALPDNLVQELQVLPGELRWTSFRMRALFKVGIAGGVKAAEPEIGSFGGASHLTRGAGGGLAAVNERNDLITMHRPNGEFSIMQFGIEPFLFTAMESAQP